MTEEERDQLASVYLDGEATSQEVALVERDSDLQLRVQKLQSVSARLGSSITISPSLKEQHLAAALAQFDPAQSLGDAGTTADSFGPATSTEPENSEVAATEGEDNIIDLASRRFESAPTLSDEPMTTVKSRSMPQWLSAAAVTLCVLGGGVWLASQMGSSSDETSFESAGAAADFDEAADSEAMTATDDAMEESSAKSVEESVEESGMADSAAAERSTTTIADRAPEDSEETSDATEVEPGEDAAADEDLGESLTDAEVAGNGGFFPNEPVASFGETPNTADLVEAPPAPPRVDLEQSQCVNEINRPVQVIGYLPIEVSGQPAEFFIFIDEAGNEDGIVLDADCQPLT